jgi:Putative MetA-pathway of phenol degradation
VSRPSGRHSLCTYSGAWWIVILAGAVLLRGQSQPNNDEPISTDRPAIAESSVVVPTGSFQAENGFMITNDQGQRSLDAPETSMRFGVASNTELRFSAPDYYRDAASGTGVGSGFGDITIGMKEQLGPTPGGFDLSVIVFLSIPTGAAAVSSHGYDPGLQLPWSRKLSANWSAAGQFALYWPTIQVDTRNLTGESTFLLDRQLTKPLDAFIEYAGDFPARGGPRHLLHFGAAYKIAPRQQLDIHYGIGLSSAAIDHFIGIGYSFRFQAIRR